MTATRFRRETDTATRSLRTVCHYNRGDRQLRSIKVEVDQFRSAKAARAEWASIAYLGTGRGEPQARTRTGGRRLRLHRQARSRERAQHQGGDPIRGMKDVLFVRGRADFVGVSGNALVRLSYLPLASSRPSFQSANTASRRRRPARRSAPSSLGSTTTV